MDRPVIRLCELCAIDRTASVDDDDVGDVVSSDSVLAMGEDGDARVLGHLCPPRLGVRPVPDDRIGKPPTLAEASRRRPLGAKQCSG